MTPDELRALVDEPSLRAEVPAAELAAAFLERISDSELNAFVTVTEELALAGARAVDEARARGRPLPLDGLPVALKDNTDLAGVRTTVGSRLFAERIAEDDAEVVRRLRAAGAVILGKTSLHELAFGATCANEAFGAVRNPWRPDRIPGGSSGGSGAALAADLCIGALGSDTGGSVRLPAAFCGVAGLRPTYGALSSRGVFPVSRSLDTVGPLARSALDLSALLEAMAGFDPADPWSLDRPLAADDPGAGIAGLRIGLPVPFFFDELDPEVEAATREAAATLAELGAELEELPLPGGAVALEACGVVIKSEALALHEAELAARPELFEQGTRSRLALAAGYRATELARAHARAAEWRHALRAAFSRAELLLAPTTPVPAPETANAGTVETTAAVVPFTHAFSLGLCPALSLPCGFAQGCPVGLQLVAPWWRDRLLLRAGAAYQRATDWHRRRPPALTPKPAARSGAASP